MLFPVVLGLLGLPSFILGNPIQAARDGEAGIEAVDDATFTAIRLYAQYAGASYCATNLNPMTPDGPIICRRTTTFNCDDVQSSDQSTLFKFQDMGISGVSGFVSIDRTRNLIVVSFRGTQTIQEVVTDLDLGLQPADDICAPVATGCKVHGGYLRAWQDSRQQIITTVQDTLANNTGKGFRVVVTGHSLGGGIATVAGLQLRNLDLGVPVDIVPYASSRAGNAAFADVLTAQGRNTATGRNLRITHVGDPNPDAPATNLNLNGVYQHFTPAFQITTQTGSLVTSGREIIQQKNVNFVNSGTFDPIFNSNAHNYYINEISACGDSSVAKVIAENGQLVLNQVAQVQRKFGAANPSLGFLLRILLALFGVHPSILEQMASSS